MTEKFCAQWEGFAPGRWSNGSVNVRDFIKKNYTPYDGDESFLAPPSEDTKKLWAEVLDLFEQERAKGGVLDMDTKIVSTITSHPAGYIDKDLEKIVGLQTDKPLKRSLQPFGGIRMAVNACKQNGYEVDPEIVEIFTKYRKTHNQGVFDAYTPEMKAARHAGIITGLPDAYGRGRIIGDYRRIALYGIDLYGEKSLYRLLDELNKIEGIYWIRILYCYPEEIDDKLIASIKRNEKVCHYLDLPIQHADDMILKRMGRRTSQADLRNIVTKLRTEIPDIALRTTLICGFPGETEKEHESLMYFINEMEFDRLGAFTYSPEEDTPAATFDNQVDEEQKKQWQQEVMELQEEVIIDANERMIGRELYCMIEGQVSGENTYVGRTYRDAPDIDGYIFIDTDETLMSGDFVKVRVTGAYEYDLIGEIA